MLVNTGKYNGEISVFLYNEESELLEIGAKMEEINPEAYMNGYNWDAFLTRYLGVHAPAVLEGLDPDPEAGMYAGHYKDTPENEVKAAKFVEIVTKLLEKPEEIYQFLRDEGETIEWD